MHHATSTSATAASVTGAAPAIAATACVAAASVRSTNIRRCRAFAVWHPPPTCASAPGSSDEHGVRRGGRIAGSPTRALHAMRHARRGEPPRGRPVPPNRTLLRSSCSMGGLSTPTCHAGAGCRRGPVAQGHYHLPSGLQLADSHLCPRRGARLRDAARAGRSFRCVWAAAAASRSAGDRPRAPSRHPHLAHSLGRHGASPHATHAHASAQTAPRTRVPGLPASRPPVPVGRCRRW